MCVLTGFMSGTINNMYALRTFLWLFSSVQRSFVGLLFGYGLGLAFPPHSIALIIASLKV